MSVISYKFWEIAGKYFKNMNIFNSGSEIKDLVSIYFFFNVVDDAF